MINKLQDVSIVTPFSNLPGIISRNNKSIEQEFDNIYDSNANRLLKSIYAPTGSVKTHFGEFVNLQCEYITIKNTDSFKSSLKNAIRELGHNELGGIFSSDNVKSAMSSDETFCHDASTIFFSNSELGVSGSLQEILSNILNSIDTYAPMSYSAANPMKLQSIQPELTSEKETTPKVLVYDKALLFQPFSTLRKKKIPLYQISDLTNGNVYSYYNVSQDNEDITINDKYVSSFETVKVGTIINLVFDDTKTSSVFKIVLSRQNSKFLEISKNPLVRVQLKATSYSIKNGTEWDLYSYSVTSSKDIKITER